MDVKSKLKPSPFHIKFRVICVYYLYILFQCKPCLKIRSIRNSQGVIYSVVVHQFVLKIVMKPPSRASPRFIVSSDGLQKQLFEPATPVL